MPATAAAGAEVDMLVVRGGAASGELPVEADLALPVVFVDDAAVASAANKGRGAVPQGDLCAGGEVMVIAPEADGTDNRERVTSAVPKNLVTGRRGSARMLGRT